jgi:elongation factor 2
MFDHWQLIEGDPLDETSLAGRILLDIRRRKGIHEAIPSLASLLAPSSSSSSS